MKTQLQQADELITQLATVVLDEGIADRIPEDLRDKVRKWLKTVHEAESVYLIVGADRGDGFHRLDTGAVLAYARRVVAEEDLNRYLFKIGHAILELPVVNSPTILPHTEKQRLAWEAKEKK